MKVWITDDDAIFHFLVERFAQSLPQIKTLQFFTNGQLLLEALKEEPEGPDVVMLDLNMPVMNGFRVLDYLSEHPELVQKLKRLFIISSSMLPEERERALSYPFTTGYYSKPIYVQQFAEMVIGPATDRGDTK